MDRLLIKCFAFALLLVPGLLPGQQRAAGDSEKGKRLFERNGCFECHGYVGQGGASGPRIAPWTVGTEALISYVRHPSGQMPPYTEKVMSDGELTDVAAYLKNILAPKPVEDIPLLRASRTK